jgi:energy-coupling factor transporter ATP-binding protein EcfA2
VSDPTPPVVQFSAVSKTFGDVKAVNRISFEIRRGEFFSILGPSGCGKTTTLRLLAGFDEPDDDGGEVRLLGEVVNTRRPYERAVAQLWNGDAEQARMEQPELRYVVPKEGSTIWLDSLVMPRGAPHPRAAHEFMNYVLRPDVEAAIATATGYGTPNHEAIKLIGQPVPYPTGEELARLEYQRDLGCDTTTWDQLWTEVKSA